MKIEAPAAAHIPALRQLWQEAFADEEIFLDAFFSKAFSCGRCLCVMEGGVPVSAAYWFDTTCYGRDMAYIYAVATRKSHRGQGLCRMLLTEIHRVLMAQGYAGALLVPGDEGLARMYERIGYRFSAFVREAEYAAGDTGAALEKLSAAEYLRRRAELLPPGGAALQEKHAPFLDTQAKFYAGEGFLTTMEQGDDGLRGIELLGNSSAAPGILRTLGAERGVFCMPGTEQAFAMYYPIDETVSPPVYFNFPFG